MNIKNNRMTIITTDKSKEFIKKFNKNNPPKEFMESCKKVNELFKRKDKIIMIYEQVTIEKEKYDELIRNSIELVSVKKELEKLTMIKKLLSDLYKSELKS